MHYFRPTEATRKKQNKRKTRINSTFWGDSIVFSARFSKILLLINCPRRHLFRKRNKINCFVHTIMRRWNSIVLVKRRVIIISTSLAEINFRVKWRLFIMSDCLKNKKKQWWIEPSNSCQKLNLSTLWNTGSVKHGCWVFWFLISRYKLDPSA